MRPTGPFDPDFPVMAFKGTDRKLAAVIFGHSTHTIGTRNPAAARRRSTGWRRKPSSRKPAPSPHSSKAPRARRTCGASTGWASRRRGSRPNGASSTLSATTLTRRRDAREPDRVAQARGHGTVRRFDEAEAQKAVVDYCRSTCPRPITRRRSPFSDRCEMSWPPSGRGAQDVDQRDAHR